MYKNVVRQFKMPQPVLSSNFVVLLFFLSFLYFVVFHFYVVFHFMFFLAIVDCQGNDIYNNQTQDLGSSVALLRGGVLPKTEPTLVATDFKVPFMIFLLRKLAGSQPLIEKFLFRESSLMY